MHFLSNTRKPMISVGKLGSLAARIWAGICCVACLFVGPLEAAQTVSLSNGDYAVVDTEYDLPGPVVVANVGAVTFYTSAGQMLGVVYGSTGEDRIGSGGVTVIDSQQYVISSPLWDNGGVADAGAVTYWTIYSQPEFTVSELNSFVGTSANDQVGSGGVTLAGNGIFLIFSQHWDNGAAVEAGAVTAVYIFGGPNAGVVSASNSLVGGSANDQVGSGGITLVDDGSFLVWSPHWDNGAVTEAGAVTWGGPYDPMWGEVSASNSLVGSHANDQIGSGGITLVGNGRIVVHSPQWDNAAVADAGAVTFGPFFGPMVGEVSASNSLVGSHANDQIGSGGITLTGDGSIVVRSPHWDNGAAADAGAVTFGPFFGFMQGEVSASNSLVGSHANDQIGSGGITLTGNGGFVVHSPQWDNGAAADVGAVTFGPFFGPMWGEVSASNSLVGSHANDQIGSGGVTLVGNGSIVVRSPQWDNGTAVDAGAVTLGPFYGAMVGELSASNSLVGSHANDQIGSGGVMLLGNGGFVVRSPQWDNGAAADAGAVTLGVGGIVGSTRGEVSAANSLVGTHANDQIGSGGITLTGDGSIVVHSPQWDNGAAAEAGAVTLGGPYRPMVGEVSASNSLVGSHANDQIGSAGITLMGNGSFVVRSPQWDNGAAADAGALTLGGPYGPTVGEVSASNSLVGSHSNDQIGSGGISLRVDGSFDGTFIVFSPLWDNGPAADAGAVTFVGFFGPPWGVISASNSLVGSHPNDQIGSGGIMAQADSGVVLKSPNWCYGAGAVTNFSFLPIIGVVSAANSIVGAESAEPVITVQQPDFTNIPSGGARDFGTVTAGSQSALSFVIKNNGTDDLLLNGIRNVLVTGSDASWFSVGAQPPSLLVAGDSATFTITFTAAGEGVRTAALAISSNDSTRSPYQIALSGTAQSQISSWRQTYFGSTANTGGAADTADFDHDGIPNLLEFAFGLSPVQNSSRLLPGPNLAGGNFVYAFTQPAGMSGITYGAEWSSSLTSNSWQPVADTGTSPQHVFSVPIAAKTQIFMRLTVTPQ